MLNIFKVIVLHNFIIIWYVVFFTIISIKDCFIEIVNIMYAGRIFNFIGSMLKPSYTIEWEANFKASVRCCNTLTIWLTSCSTVLSTLCNTESICSRVFDRLLMSCCKIAMSAEFPATKQFIVDVAIAQMSKPIFSVPLLILAINFNTTADVCSTLHTLSNTFIIFLKLN